MGLNEMRKMKKESIYIVEEDKFFNDLLRGKLHSLGYENIESFHTAMSCIDKLDKSPDIILLDHNLKGISGIEILQRIKAYNSKIIVIYISGHHDMQIALDSIKYGAFDYIAKDSKT